MSLLNYRETLEGLIISEVSITRGSAFPGDCLNQPSLKAGEGFKELFRVVGSRFFFFKLFISEIKSDQGHKNQL